MASLLLYGCTVHLLYVPDASLQAARTLPWFCTYTGRVEANTPTTVRTAASACTRRTVTNPLACKCIKAAEGSIATRGVAHRVCLSALQLQALVRRPSLPLLQRAHVQSARVGESDRHQFRSGHAPTGPGHHDILLCSAQVSVFVVLLSLQGL